MKRLWLVLTALMAASCGGGGALVVVTVSSNGPISGITQLDLTITAAGQMMPIGLPAGSHSAIPPSLTFGVELPAARVGAFTAKIRALDANMALLAEGEESTTSVAGQRVDLTVTLGGGGMADMAMPDLEGIDAAVPDGCVPRSTDCGSLGFACGTIDPGCGGTPVSCGTCLITAVEPQVAQAGDTLTVEGAFGPSTMVVFPGPSPAATVAATLLGPNRATVIVPLEAAAGPLAVSVGGVTVPQRVPFRRLSFPPGIGQFSTSYPQTDAARPMSTFGFGARGSAIFPLGITYMAGGQDIGAATDFIMFAGGNSDGTMFQFYPSPIQIKLVVPRSYAVSAVFGSFAYLIGGWNGTNTVYASVERATISSNAVLSTFSTVTAVNLQTARWGAASAVIGPYLYVIGGATAVSFNTPAAITSIERSLIDSNGNLGPFQAVSSQLVTARAGAHAAVVGNNLYVIGGRNDSATLGTIEHAPVSGDGSLGTFMIDAGTVDPRAFATGVRMGNKVILAGGSNPSPSPLATIVQSTVSGDALGGFSFATQSMGAPRSAARAALVGNNLHIIGGTADFALPSVERASIDVGMSGSTPSPAPQVLANSRFGMAEAVVGNYLYLFGGDPGMNDPLTNVARFQINPDGSLGMFSNPGIALSVGRAGAQVAVLGPHVYVYGGKTGAGIVATGDHFTLDTTGSLVAAAAPPNMTTPRAYFNMVAVRGKLYAIGGSGAAASTAETLNFDTGGVFTTVWTTSGAPTLTSPHEKRMAVMVGNNYYLIGGADPSAVVDVAVVSGSGLGNFSPSAQTLVEPRYFGGIVERGLVVLLAGGITGNVNLDMGIGPDTDTIDVSVISSLQLTNFVRTTLRSSSVRHGHNTVVLGNFLYNIGGHDGTMPLGSIEVGTLR